MDIHFCVKRTRSSSNHSGERPGYSSTRVFVLLEIGGSDGDGGGGGGDMMRMVPLWSVCRIVRTREVAPVIIAQRRAEIRRFCVFLWGWPYMPTSSMVAVWGAAMAAGRGEGGGGRCEEEEVGARR